eukprot:5725379-Pyramimonas_sp.AAC.1
MNPPYHPNYDDGSARYIVVECKIQDTAALADKGAHERQVARNILRRRPALTYQSEQADLIGTHKADRAHDPKLTYEEQRLCSEWLATALRRKPFHSNHLSNRFLRAVPSFD